MSTSEIRTVKNGQWEPVSNENPVPVLLYAADGNPLVYSAGKMPVRASELEALIGEVSNNPAANTLLARLKALEDKLAGTINTTLTGSRTGVSATATQTRPNDINAYLIGDVIGENPATNLIFDNVLPNAGGTFVILGARVRIDVNAIPAGMIGFRLHLYNTPPTAILDSEPYDLVVEDRSKYLGHVNILTIRDLVSTVFVQEDNINFTGKLASDSTTLYGILETIGSYTPSASTVKTISIIVTGV